MDKQVEQLKDMLERSAYTVAITGAGISVGSGGMTFADSRPGDMRGIMAIGSEDALRNQPEEYYAALDRSFLHSMFTGGPDTAHRVMADWEAKGKLAGIITTNVDCLHTMAGSKNVAEIQGSLQVNQCCECKRQYNSYHIWENGKVPECTACGGKIWAFPFYSHIGLYDQAVAQAQEWISKAELILVVGSNGPYAGAYWGYRRRRAKVAQINPSRTNFDGVSSLNIRRSAEDVFVELEGAI